MQPLIELQDLTHTYTDAENNQVLALQKINLQIGQGEGPGAITCALRRAGSNVCKCAGKDDKLACWRGISLPG